MNIDNDEDFLSSFKKIKALGDVLVQKTVKGHMVSIGIKNDKQFGPVIMFGLGSQELIIILVIVVVLFGAKRLPQLGAGLGKGITNFKKGLKGQDNDQIDSSDDKEV